MKGIGEIMAQLIVWVLGAFGLEVPIYFVNLLMIVLIIFALMKIGSTVSKLMLVILVFLLLANAQSMFSFP
ncbi:MAG: hypothetical protein L6M37_02260 [Candidatus Methylarchaceae archaeon HK02M1]|nr:hypothetical protein [Candidatus Methylarchaceae archaeon HK01M]MCP8311761.1 hypothetical protein [Candidatus Methylarchaceae archaeon HK02M1]